MHVIGHRIIRLTQTDSTNREAWRLIEKENPSAGTIIVASYQNQGKGQGGNKWESERGENLLFSLIIEPRTIPVVKQFLINISVSLAICEAVSSLISDRTVLIKWPNDIYVENKKLAGILIENSIMADMITHCVIGIGINVNQTLFFSDAPNPVSLAQLSGEAFDLKVCLSCACIALEKWFTCLFDGEFAKIRELYHLTLLGFGTPRYFKANEEVFEGTITGVSEYGQLIIKHHDRIRQFDMKEVSFLF